MTKKKAIRRSDGLYDHLRDIIKIRFFCGTPRSRNVLLCFIMTQRLHF